MNVYISGIRKLPPHDDNMKYFFAKKYFMATMLFIVLYQTYINFNIQGATMNKTTRSLCALLLFSPALSTYAMKERWHVVLDPKALVLPDKKGVMGELGTGTLTTLVSSKWNGNTMEEELVNAAIGEPFNDGQVKKQIPGIVKKYELKESEVTRNKQWNNAVIPKGLQTTPVENIPMWWAKTGMPPFLKKWLTGPISCKGARLIAGQAIEIYAANQTYSRWFGGGKAGDIQSRKAKVELFFWPKKFYNVVTINPNALQLAEKVVAAGNVVDIYGNMNQELWQTFSQKYKSELAKAINGVTYISGECGELKSEKNLASYARFFDLTKGKKYVLTELKSPRLQAMQMLKERYPDQYTGVRAIPLKVDEGKTFSTISPRLKKLRITN